MSGVLVLNASYEVLNVVSLHRAVVYLIKEKAEVVQADAGRVIRAASKVIPVPRVVRLLRYVRIPGRARTPAWSRRGVLQRDGHSCAYCGGRAATVDHVLPRSRGGADAWLNTVAACGPCNNAKGDRTPREAGMPLRLRPVEPKVRTALLVAVAALDPAMVTSLGLA